MSGKFGNMRAESTKAVKAVKASVAPKAQEVTYKIPTALYSIAMESIKTNIEELNIVTANKYETCGQGQSLVKVNEASFNILNKYIAEYTVGYGKYNTTIKTKGFYDTPIELLTPEWLAENYHTVKIAITPRCLSGASAKGIRFDYDSDVAEFMTSVMYIMYAMVSGADKETYKTLDVQDLGALTKGITIPEDGFTDVSHLVGRAFQTAMSAHVEPSRKASRVAAKSQYVYENLGSIVNVAPEKDEFITEVTRYYMHLFETREDYETALAQLKGTKGLVREGVMAQFAAIAPNIVAFTKMLKHSDVILATKLMLTLDWSPSSELSMDTKVRLANNKFEYDLYNTYKELVELEKACAFVDRPEWLIELEDEILVLGLPTTWNQDEIERTPKEVLKQYHAINCEIIRCLEEELEYLDSPRVK